MIAEKKLNAEIEAPEGVEVKIEGRTLTAKGPKGEISKELMDPTIEIKVDGNKVKLKALKHTKRQKTMVSTFRAHINNIFKGVTDEFEYKLKICSSHFPMSVSVEGDKVVVKNFLGEKVPRKAVIIPGATVKVQGDNITVTSPNKEVAGQTAANIEQATRITNRDRRIFQDGIWITEKSGKGM